VRVGFAVALVLGACSSPEPPPLPAPPPARSLRIAKTTVRCIETKWGMGCGEEFTQDGVQDLVERCRGGRLYIYSRVALCYGAGPEADRRRWLLHACDFDSQERDCASEQGSYCACPDQANVGAAKPVGSSAPG
jgi:hypothetical protein